MGALTGLKVLDFSTLLPGPFATLYLADLGAEVLRVEAPNRASLDTYAPPLVADGFGATSNLSANVAYLGRNKKSLHIDMKKPEARDVIFDLVQEYDIVVDQFRPGVMDRLGVGYEALKEANPRVIYCALTGYGQEGPLAMRAGHDINYLARSGLMSYSGSAEQGPSLYGVQIADVCCGSLNTVIGILSAVVYRDRTGKGQYVDVSMHAGAIALNAATGANALYSAQEGGSEQPTYASEMLNGGSLYDFYETKDGRYLSVGPVEPKFFKLFCEGIGHPELMEQGMISPKDPAVKDLVRDCIKERTLSEWVAVFDGTDACVEPVLTIEEAVLDDAQAKERNMLVNVPVTGAEGKAVQQLGNPLVMSECEPVYRHAGHLPGYDTEEVVRGLGYDEDRLAELWASGVFGAR